MYRAAWDRPEVAAQMRRCGCMEEIQLELTKRCWRCERKAITLDEKRRPLCARHAMIFVSAPRIMEAQNAEADSGTEVTSEPDGDATDSEADEGGQLPFEDRRDGSVEVSLTLFRISPERAMSVFEGTSGAAGSDGSAATGRSSNSPPSTPVRGDAGVESDQHRPAADTSASWAVVSDDNRRAALRDREYNRSTVGDDESVCAYAGRPLPSQWRRFLPRPQ